MVPCIHLVWGTKYRQPVLTPIFKRQVIEHIQNLAHTKGLTIHALDGHKDHLHALVENKPGQDIAWVVKTLKGGSSYWANHIANTKPKLYWASGYYYAHVPVEAFIAVKLYIENQESHHRVRTFHDEYVELLVSQGLKPR